MVIEYIRYKVTDGAALESAYEMARSAMDASSHCLAYELSRCVEEPSCYVLRIEWDSTEGHLEGFRKSPEFRDFLTAVRPFIADIQEMRHYEVTKTVARKASA